jgi:hypothetical protein
VDSRAVTSLFDRYESLFNAALDGKPDLKAMSDLYESAFIGAAPAGVMTGTKGPEFDKAMSAGFSHSRKIGTRRMKVQRVLVEPIDELHAIARVDWQASYDAKAGPKVIDFTNVYLTREENGQAKVFGWITGDEEAELRKHGIV